MLKYKSLLKGEFFKNKNIKSSFLIEDKKNNNLLLNNLRRNDNKRLKLYNSSIKDNNKKSSKNINFDNYKKIDNDKSFTSGDYEDLFFSFLLETEGIDIFEKQLELKKDKKIRINKKYIFNYIYQVFTEEKKRWNNFLFTETVYQILYIKSRKVIKEIIQYSVYSGAKIKDIINSYDKKYTCKRKVKNWSLRPQEAYKNYENIKLKAKLEKEKNNNVGNYFKTVNNTDFVVKTDNFGNGKTLIFLGKAINIYIDDLDKFHKNDKGISMAVEESEFNKKIKNEIVYTYDDIILKTKKRNMTINSNRFEMNKLKNENTKKSIDKKSFKNFKTNLNLDFKNSNKFFSLDKNEKNRTKIYNQKPNINIFNNYQKHLNKLPNITKLEKTNNKNKKNENRENSNTKSNKNVNINYRRVFPNFQNKKKSNKFINSFNIFEKEYIPKSHKKLINFFTKENSDFYY